MMSHTRLLCLTVAAIVVVWSSVSPAPDRTYVAGNFALVLDGTKCGFIRSIDGGAITAEVINEPAGPGKYVKKHIGQPKYEECAVHVGFSMAKPVYEWVAQSWKMNYQRKNGSIIATDYKLQAQSERQFMNALITETTIPAMDGASKEPAYMTIKFAPEAIRFLKADGDVGGGEFGKNEQKMFLPCNFKLQIDGLDCSRVSKIDSFTVKQTVVTDDIGDARDYLKEPGKLEFPNLKITMAEAGAQSWLDWHEAFVVKGENDEVQEKNGVLTLLSPNRQTELVRIKFFNMGIFRIQADKSEANADSIKRMTAELYVEKMEFEYVGAETAPATPPATSPTAPATTPTAPTKQAPFRRG